MEKIKAFLKENQAKIALFIGLILVSVLSFEAGFLKGSGSQNKQISIETTSKCSECSASTASGAKASLNPLPKTEAPKNDLNVSWQNCAFVGSKNSTKYHLPTCSSAKRIKAENLVCFQSAEEASSKGYAPSQDCIK